MSQCSQVKQLKLFRANSTAHEMLVLFLFSTPEFGFMSLFGRWDFSSQMLCCIVSHFSYYRGADAPPLFPGL